VEVAATAGPRPRRHMPQLWRLLAAVLFIIGFRSASEGATRSTISFCSPASVIREPTPRSDIACDMAVDPTELCGQEIVIGRPPARSVGFSHGERVTSRARIDDPTAPCAMDGDGAMLAGRDRQKRLTRG